jgi:hypothetical protein
VSDYRTLLRAELVAAAERPLPRARPSRTFVLRTATVAVAAAAIALGIFVLPWSASRAPRPAVHRAQLPGEPLFGGSLQAGERYRTQRLVPQISFVANGDRWFASDSDTRDGLLLLVRAGHLGGTGSPELAPVLGLGFAHVPQVYVPGTLRVMPAPKDLVGWLKANPLLGVTSVRRTSLAGGPATALAFRVPRHPAQLEPGCRYPAPTKLGQVPRQNPCAALAPGLSPAVNSAGTLIVPDGPDPLVVSEFALDPSRAGEIARDAAPLLASLLIAR